MIFLTAALYVFFFLCSIVDTYSLPEDEEKRPPARLEFWLFILVFTGILIFRPR